METTPTAEIAILLPCPTGTSAPYTTPFGEVFFLTRSSNGRNAILIEPADDPRAAPWAARAWGATRLVACASGAALNRLLRPRDWVVADDYVDQTRGQPTTYFSDRGLGYVQQVPAFCPEICAALACQPEEPGTRIFSRGTYVAQPSARRETPAEARWWRRLGGDVCGGGVLPELTLGRELGLCTAVTCYVAREAGGPDEAWLEAVHDGPLLSLLATELPLARACRCADSLASARARGVLEEDWWKTLAPAS